MATERRRHPRPDTAGAVAPSSRANDIDPDLNASFPRVPRDTVDAKTVRGEDDPGGSTIVWGFTC